MPSVPPRPATTPAIDESMPSPPVDTTTSPRATASATISGTTSALEVWMTWTVAPAASSARATGAAAAGATPPPDVGFTRKVKDLMG
jgi:hypothetical protein